MKEVISQSFPAGLNNKLMKFGPWVRVRSRVRVRVGTIEKNNSLYNNWYNCRKIRGRSANELTRVI